MPQATAAIAADLGHVERQLGQRDPVRGRVGERAQRVAQHRRLLEDLLLHEVAVVALADQRPAQRGLADRPLRRPVLGVDHHRTLAVEKADIAFLEILDALGQRGQGQGVGADEHLVVAVADRQRAALARDDQQILVALEQDRQRERALEPAHGGGRRLARRHAPLEMRADQVRHDLGIGLGRETVAVRQQLGAQDLEILDDAIVDQGDAGADMRVRVGLVGGAVGGPAGVADAGDAAQRLGLEPLGQMVQLAGCPPPLDPAGHQRGDPGAVVAAIFEPPQRVQQKRRCRPAADHPDDATHDPGPPPRREQRAGTHS